MDNYIKVLKKWDDFKGRSRRSEYWYFALANFVIGFIFQIVIKELASMTVTAVYVAYVLILIIPSLAVMVRRLHDIGKSGWMAFISLIPIVGAIWLLILFARDGDSGDNKYGPNPKATVLPAQPVAPQV